MATEPAFLIDTNVYLKWLVNDSQILNEFVTAVEKKESGIEIKTQLGNIFNVDQVVYAGGCNNRNWDEKKAGKPVQGCYFEFNDCDLGQESFSLTLEGDNFIYHGHTKKLLIGSTTSSDTHELPARQELEIIYQRLSERLAIKLPAMETAQLITGMREKAAKRAPYLTVEGNTAWLGGLYKNGFSLSLHLGLQLAAKFDNVSES
jgi:hypothetical protein